MGEEKKIKSFEFFGRKNILFFCVISLIIFIFSLVFTNFELKTESLKNINRTLSYIDFIRIKYLIGKNKQTMSEDYAFLKQQLSDAVKHNPSYKKLSFVGKTKEGKHINYVDSVFLASSYIKTQNQQKEEVEIQNRHLDFNELVFYQLCLDNLGERVVSIAVSLKQEKYGNIDAFFVIDISLATWIKLIFTKLIVLLSLSMFLFFAGLFFFFPYRFIKKREKFITRKIMPYLFFVITVMLLVCIASLFKQKQYFLDKSITEKASAVPFKFNQLIKNNLENIKSLSELVANSQQVKSVLNNGDRDLLHKEFDVFYKTLKYRNMMNYFSFYTPEGINILRFHNDKYGDFTGNRILRKAIEKRKMIAGAELDPSGDVVIRAVTPVFVSNLLVGFVETGLTIDHVVSDLGLELNLGVVFFVDKQYISKRDFIEKGGTLEDWNRYYDKLLLYNSAKNSATNKNIYDSIIASHNVNNMTHNYNIFDFEYDNHSFSINIFPFFDVMGQNVGHFIVVYDFSDSKTFFDYIVKIDGAVFIVLSLFLFMMVYLILKSTDENILRQQYDILEREQYLTAMSGVLDYGVIITDSLGQIVLMNKMAQQITGCSVEKKHLMPIESVFDHLMDESGGCLSPHPVRAVIASGKEVKAARRFVFVSSDKKEYFINYSAYPITNDKNKVLSGTVLFIEDITGKYKKVKEMEVVNTKLQIGLNALGVGVWEYNLLTKELLWDNNMRSLYGVAEEEAIDVSKWFNVFIHQEDKKDVVSQIRQALQNGFRFEVESRIILRDGEVRYVKAAGIPLGDGRSYVGVNYDVSEQKFFENKMQTSEHALRLLMENAVIAISVNELKYDDEGNPTDCLFREVNKSFASFVNGEVKDITGKFASQVLPELQQVQYLKMFDEVLKTGKSLYVDKYSDSLNCWYSINAYKTEENYFALVIYDITGHKENEEKLNNIIEENKKQVERFQKSQHIALSIMEDANTARKEAEVLKLKAEKAYKAKSQFLANMSHEIRTPMNAILGYSNLLGATPLAENQQEFLKMICSSGELLISIIDDILDVSKFEAGRIMLESIDFDLKYLCGNVMKMLMPQIKDKQIKTYIDFAKDIPATLKGDPTRLRQVLINLLANAVKFTNKGSIGLSVICKEIKQEGKICVLEFRVSDTGIGIARNKQKGIFEAFDQANKSITREYGGTGLGLAICKAVVGAMGGEIKVRSVKGKGSEFIFTVEVATTGSKKNSEIDRNLTVKDLEGKKVVILDSVGKTRDNLNEYCLEKNMNVVGVYADAKSFYRDTSLHGDEGKTPDIMLIDAVLSDDSGMEIVRSLKDKYVFAKTKFVMVTSDVRAGTAKAAHDAGFNGYLAKPLVKEDFYKVILFILGNNSNVDSLVTRHLVNEELPNLLESENRQSSSLGLEKIKKKPEKTETETKKEKKEEKVKGKNISSGLKVILAEDNIVNQKLMQEYFKIMCFDFDIVDNGEKAVEKIRNNYYDICFMDVQMPIMDGLEATKIIREEISKDFVIVGISANVMEEHKKSAMDAGFNDYLKKPVNVDMLKKVVAKWC